jgi:hypothetical protein
MQRDMDLIRQILIRMEEYPHGYAPQGIEIDGFTKEQIGYHAALMGEAALVRVTPCTTISDPSPSAIPISLTWAGYEFLAASKDEGIWKKGTSTLMAKAGAIGFDILKAVLTAEIRRQVGLP